MPYCPECGIHYLQPNSTCVSCGRDLSDVINSPDSKSATFGKTAPPDPALDESVTDFSGFRAQVEGHIGKGLVKPQSVEIGVDGFHFKYDHPPHKLVKSEALKDKIIEFRVTAPMDPSEQFSEKDSAAPMDPPEQLENETAAPGALPEDSFQGESGFPLEFEERMVGEEPVTATAPIEFSKMAEPDEPENQVEPENAGAPMAESKNPVESKNLVEPEAKILPEIEPATETGSSPMEGPFTVEESVPWETDAEYPPVGTDEGFGIPVDEAVPELPEPELKELEEPEVLWEGKGSWYGFGARTQYRLTNQSVAIIEPYSYRFTEFELALISHVKLHRTWLMKLLRIGDISITVSGLPEPGLVLKGIREPEKVKGLLEELLA